MLLMVQLIPCLHSLVSDVAITNGAHHGGHVEADVLRQLDTPGDTPPIVSVVG